jgi:phosphate transport system substrate-binding protein
MRNILVTLCLALLLLAGCRGSTNPQTPGDAPASAYIENKGSDTIVNIALAWAEAYQKIHPQVRISVTGGGSGTGITALINGSIPLANASRQIKPEELEAARAAGLDPKEFVIARDAIAVIVNPENPINQITIEQLAAIYTGQINNWSELGGEDRPIVRLSRETNSGTHVFFLEKVVRMGDSSNKVIFAADTCLLPSSEGIISEVRENPNAIGYDGLGYVTDEVKMLAVSSVEDPARFVLPSLQSVSDNSYYISRNLYMYTQNTPSGELKNYLDWLLSPEAQQIVADLGFVPVSDAGAAQ